mmetsp:Transcript_26019/g.47183  ORF Transcript_26019/g.47183 Transcript_26019/m.47183 type:complete len:119 (-) Transcript_26019:105-461(-)
MSAQVKGTLVHEPLGCHLPAGRSRSRIVGDTLEPRIIRLGANSKHTGARVKRGVTHLKHVKTASMSHAELDPTIPPFRSFLEEIYRIPHHDAFHLSFTEQSFFNISILYFLCLIFPGL